MRSYGLSVDLSGIIFVVLAVAWAVYLIPKALRHHDEVARTRSVDRFSTAMRVLAHREPVSRRDARLVVTPARAADNPRVLAPSTAAPTQPQRPVNPAARRAAARAAARRRRRILSFLLLADVVVAVLAAVAVTPWWAEAVPAGLTVLYLVLCRTQVRAETSASWERELLASAEQQPVHDEAEAEPAERVVVRNAQGFEEVDADDDTLTLPAVVDAVVVATDDGGSLWDPLPVTLPTYVTKPKARRTVRTIDLNEPNTWTSGRTAEDAALVAETAAAAEAEGAEVEQQRAVGS